jgi:PST family polysaccharide transporter
VALKRIAFGAAALSAARMFQLAASFLTVPFMARLLDPHDFGLVALGMATVSIVVAFSDAGMSRSLVRTSELDSDAWSSAHWLITGAMAIVSLILFAAAWPASIFFNMPALMPVMMALAIIPVMQGFLELPIASLIKRENLMPMAIGDFSAAAAGAAVAIAAGLAGWGAWALVAQNITNVAIRWPVILIAAKFRPRFVFKLSALQDHLRFARDTIAYSAMNVIGKQIDPFVIGKVLGAASLGLYSVAFRIMSLPSSAVATPVQTALYPRLAALRDKPDELRALVLAATIGQAMLVFPPMAAAAAAGHAFFEILLSERWSASAVIFSALVVAGMTQAITMFNSSLLQAIGRTGARLQITTEFAVLWALTAIFVAQFGTLALATAFSIVSVLYIPRSLSVFLNRIQCTQIEYAKALMGPVLASLAIVGAHLIFQRLFELENWQELALAMAETAAAYAALLLFGRRDIERRLREVRSIISRPSEA